MRNVIYMISNTINDKIYIGSAVRFNFRVNVHKSYLRKGKHHSRKLQNHVNKYGIESLIFKVIENVGEAENLINREQFYIDSLKPFFNSRQIAHSQLGYKHTEESKRKMVESRRKNNSYNRKISEETKKKISLAKKGKPCSEETKEKIRKSTKGRVLSEEHLRKVRDYFANNKKPPVSEETRSKLSKQKMGKLNPMWGKKGVNNHRYGVKCSEETLNKFRNSGRKIINLSTGVIYEGMYDCCLKTGMHKSSVYRQLTGQLKVNNFSYYEEN